MSTKWVLTSVLCLLSVSACGVFNRSQAVSVNTEDPALYTTWHASLASPSSLAGVVQMNGSASMAPSRDSTSTVVTLLLANASPGGLHPWSAHEGQCGSGTDYGVFGSSAQYERAEVDSNGEAKSTATLSQRTPRTGGYFVAVYASAANPMVVACGNLAPPAR